MRRRSLGVRRHALLVRPARWTNAEHSSSFVVCVGIFVHAQNCARSSTQECTRQKDASHAQSALDQRRTASFFFGVYPWLVKVLGQFSIIYFRGLGLRIGVRVWVRVRVRVGVRVWVRVRVRVRVRVSVVLWSG